MMATAAILEIKKSRYLSKGLTDLHEIGHDDAKWVFQPPRPLKIGIYKNPRWRKVVIVKTVKSPYPHNCLTDFDEIWQADAEPVN